MKHPTLPPHCPSACNPLGFSLLEVMISLSILAITLVTLYSSQSRSLSYTAETLFNTQGPLLSSQKLAELSLTAGQITTEEGDFGENFPGYTWKIETEEADFDSSELLSSLSLALQKIILTITDADSGFAYTTISYLQIRQ